MLSKTCPVLLLLLLSDQTSLRSEVITWASRRSWFPWEHPSNYHLPSLTAELGGHKQAAFWEGNQQGEFIFYLFSAATDFPPEFLRPDPGSAGPISAWKPFYGRLPGFFTTPLNLKMKMNSRHPRLCQISPCPSFSAC